ncbi:MAG: trypsin-like peptidase domain-containing protein [Verrucomicrobiae bacterium]|nr:trypsin-like peptidase domain-containing protein [Verrucomicrobiae bacterium]
MFRFLLIGILLATPLRAITWHGGMTEQDSIDLAWSQSAFDATCRVIVRNTSGSVTQVGTGVLIADRWVLTARHLFGTNSDPANLTCQFEPSPGGSRTSRTSVGYVTRNPDIALVELASDAPSWVPRVPPYLDSDEVTGGWIFTKVGYGGIDSAGSQSNVRRACTNRFYQESNDWLDFQRDATAPEKTEWEGGTAPGDSGGPAFLFKDGLWWVVSLTNGAVPGVGLREVRVSTRMTWIRNQTGLPFERPVVVPVDLVWSDSFETASTSANSDLAARQAGSWVEANGTVSYQNEGWPVFQIGTGEQTTRGLHLEGSFDSSGGGFDLPALTLAGHPDFTGTGLGTGYELVFDLSYDLTGGFGGFADNINVKLSTDASAGRASSSHFLALSIYNDGGLRLSGDAIANATGDGTGLLAEETGTWDRIRIFVDEAAGKVVVRVNGRPVIHADFTPPAAGPREIRIDGRANSTNATPKTYSLSIDNLVLENSEETEAPPRVSAVAGGGAFELRVDSKEGERFDVLRSFDMDSFAPWKRNVPATGGLTTIDDPDFMTNDRAFYQIIRR